MAAASNGSIAAFFTCYYDDYTRSAVTVLVGTAAEHWRRGLGKAVMTEVLRRLQAMVNGIPRTERPATTTTLSTKYGMAGS